MQNGKPTLEMIAATKRVLAAEAQINTVKPVVEKLQKDILAKYQFKSTDMGDVIMDAKLSYLMSDADFEVYHAEYHAALKANGFNLPKDHCPLLVAEYELTKAQWALCDSIQHITKVPTDVMTGHPAEYKEMLSLTKKYVAQFIK